MKHIIKVNRNPAELNTANIQLWQKTMMGLIPLAEARELVTSGKYGVSTEQAIFYIQDSKFCHYV